MVSSHVLTSFPRTLQCRSFEVSGSLTEMYYLLQVLCSTTQRSCNDLNIFVLVTSHKFCIYNEAKQKLCTPFTCLFHFCTFLSRSRRIGDAKLPFLKFYREREQTAANLNFLPRLLNRTSKFSSWVVPLAFKS